MTIWLHVCCGDCLLRFLVSIGYKLSNNLTQYVKNYSSYQQKDFSNICIHLVYINPNIYPKSEYEARLNVVRHLAEELNLPLHIADYRPSDYFSLPAPATQLRTNVPASSRCQQCQTYRLQTTLDIAAQSEPVTSFSTTMLASNYLDRHSIIAQCQQLANTNHTQFWQPQFLTNPTTLQTSGYYKQNYCGCLFSLTDKTRAKFTSNVV